jgi:UDP-N-acetylglucosamine 2-epimerase (non-hydrolysing)
MNKRHRTIVCVVGARPNYMKAAPIVASLRQGSRLTPLLVHTGQHYDPEMNDTFFAELGLPAPDANLEVGSASHAVQTAQVMIRFEPVLDQAADPVVLVVGDVNSTLACALVAAKKGVPVVHVEAGLRSGDRSMPEEINRLLTDRLSDLLFTTEADAARNLAAEGIEADRVHFVGNVMIDTLRANLPRAIAPSVTLAAAGLSVPARFALSTLHRPANVDDPAVLARLLDTLREIGTELPVVLPLHPRTRARIAAAGLESHLDGRTLLPLGPVNYLGMLGLMRDARMVLTDSGGIQEETTALGIPCLTLRDNTERPVTVTEGTNRLVGSDPSVIRAEVRKVLAAGPPAGRVPDLWDGRAAGRIADVLERELGHAT